MSELIKPNFIEQTISEELGDVDIRLIHSKDQDETTWRIYPNMNLLPNLYQDIILNGAEFAEPNRGQFTDLIKSKVKAVKKLLVGLAYV